MLRSLVTGFAGSDHGKFFKIVAPHINRKKKPGVSPIPAPTFLDWLKAGPFVLINTPNTVWAAIALAMHYIAPYDLSAAGAAAAAPFSAAFFAQRLPLWLAVWGGYTGYWHVTLYWLRWAERPMVTDRTFKYAQLAHNLFWSISGVVIWVGFENVFAYLWATGRLPYMSDAEATGSRAGKLNFVLGLALTPIWRDFHFYFAHRLLHFNSMYAQVRSPHGLHEPALPRRNTGGSVYSHRVGPTRTDPHAQVHSLHHRNTDVEPFAGLCMHPVEHLYYYACILPSLVFYCSPFHFLWNGTRAPPPFSLPP